MSQARIRAYDAAGYEVLVLLDYSGNALLPQALRRRLWPAQVELSASFRATLSSLRVFLPGAEEVGSENFHLTSPFLTEYIQAWDPATGPKKADEYATPTELRKLIADRGGIPVLAHPWLDNIDSHWIAEFPAIEIYNAFGAVYFRRPVTEFMRSKDRNAVMLEAWDKALALNPSVIGIAVNDHFGPLPDFPVDADLRDSGKIIVLAEDYTLEAYRRAFERGAVLAIKDVGTIKDRYPEVRSMLATDSSVFIDTDGSVQWISMGSVVGSGPQLQTSALPERATYVRAEIRDADGSVVYTQAFTIRPVGDADGNNVVDQTDEAICREVRNGVERTPERVAACR